MSNDEPQRSTNGGEPERMDAPNQQAVGQPHPSEEGTGGSSEEPPAADETPDTEPAEQTTSEGGRDLESMTKEELLSHAQDVGASPANAGMNKAELIASIEAKRASA